MTLSYFEQLMNKYDSGIELTDNEKDAFIHELLEALNEKVCELMRLEDKIIRR